MSLKDLCCIIHSDGDDGAAAFGSQFKASLMERQKLQFILPLIPGSLRENADRNTGFDPVSYTHLDVYKRQELAGK